MDVSHVNAGYNSATAGAIFVAFGKEVDCVGAGINDRCPYYTNKVGDIGTPKITLQKRWLDLTLSNQGPGYSVDGPNDIHRGGQEDQLFSAVGSRCCIDQRFGVPLLFRAILVLPKNAEDWRVDDVRVHVMVGKIARLRWVGIAGGIRRRKAMDPREAGQSL